MMNMIQPSADYPLDTQEELRVRYGALDSLRGIAAVLVSFHHLQVASHFYHTTLVRNAYLAVELFFVLSGFVIAHAYSYKISGSRELASFAVKRVGRLWPLHVTLLLLFILAETAMWALSNTFSIPLPRPPFSEDRTLLGIPINFFMLNGIVDYEGAGWNAPSWSVSTELLAYLLFGLICAMTLRARNYLIHASIMAAALFGIVFSVGPSWVERCLLGFFLGAICWRFKGYWPGRFINLQQISAVLIVAALLSLTDPVVQKAIIPFAFAVLIITLSKQNGYLFKFLENRFLLYLGKISYSIYMVHFLLAFFVSNLIKVAGNVLGEAWIYPGTDLAYLAQNRWMMDVISIFYCLLCIAFASITFYFIERPGMNFAAKLASRMAQRRPSPTVAYAG